MTDRWRDRARCYSEHPNRFHSWDVDTPEGYRNDEELEALRADFCWLCPVRAACLRDGMIEEFGVRGGLTEDDRRQVTQLVCHCGADIDPKDMLDRNRRHFCGNCRPMLFDRSSKV